MVSSDSYTLHTPHTFHAHIRCPVTFEYSVILCSSSDPLPLHLHTCLYTCPLYLADWTHAFIPLTPSLHALIPCQLWVPTAATLFTTLHCRLVPHTPHHTPTAAAPHTAHARLHVTRTHTHAYAPHTRWVATHILHTHLPRLFIRATHTRTYTPFYTAYTVLRTLRATFTHFYTHYTATHTLPGFFATTVIPFCPTHVTHTRLRCYSGHCTHMCCSLHIAVFPRFADCGLRCHGLHTAFGYGCYSAIFATTRTYGRRICHATVIGSYIPSLLSVDMYCIWVQWTLPLYTLFTTDSPSCSCEPLGSAF